MTVAIPPPNPSNVLTLRYRVDQGLVRTARGYRVLTDLHRGIEYHRVTFPDLPAGERVSYVAVASCARGAARPIPRRLRRSPPHFSWSLRLFLPRWRTGFHPSANRIERRPTSSTWHDTRSAPRARNRGRHSRRIHVVNWFWSPMRALSLASRPARRCVRTAATGLRNHPTRRHRRDERTRDRRNGGGRDALCQLPGLLRLRRGRLPEFSRRAVAGHRATRTAPRIETAHPEYLWLNRLQCVGIGEVRMKELIYSYDLYAMR